MKTIKKVLLKDNIILPNVNQIVIGNIYNFMYQEGSEFTDVRGKVIQVNNETITIVLQPD